MMHSILAQAAGTTADPLARGQELVQSAYRWLTENGLRFATSLLTAVIIYLIGAWLANLIRRLLVRGMEKRGMDQTFAGYTANILHGVILTLVIITALGQLGIPTAQFAALIAAAGLAIGLALQGNLSNFASGFLLVFFRPFKRGDYLTAGGTEGTAEEIGVFTTTFVTLDNRKVIVPNSAITGGNITNFTANPKRVVAVPCLVGGQNPPDKVRKSLLSTTAGIAHIASEPAPVAVITHLAEGKYTMELRVWCPAEKYWDVLFALNESVKNTASRDGLVDAVPVMRILKD